MRPIISPLIELSDNLGDSTPRMLRILCTVSGWCTHSLCWFRDLLGCHSNVAKQALVASAAAAATPHRAAIISYQYVSHGSSSRLSVLLARWSRRRTNIASVGGVQFPLCTRRHSQFIPHARNVECGLSGAAMPVAGPVARILVIALQRYSPFSCCFVIFS